MKAQSETARSTHGNDQPLDPVQAAADYGIDITQLRDNLALPVAEGLRRHQIALNTVEKLQKVKRQ